MKKIIKIFTAILSVFSVIIMCLTVYGNFALPDSADVIGNDITFSRIYSAAFSGGGDSPVISQAENSGDSPVQTSTIKLLNTFPVKTIEMHKTSRRYVAAGGELIGIKLKTCGVLIVGTESFECAQGTVNPAAEAGIQIGDILLSIDSTAVTDNKTLTKIIENSGGKTLSLTLQRNGEEYSTGLTPRKSVVSDIYKGGLWIRDCSCGIGTLTYSDISSGTIASLGHGIYDVDTKAIVPAKSGEFTSAKLAGIKKGENGTAGELRGIIGDELYGELKINCDAGIYGNLAYAPRDCELVPVAGINEIKTGSAQIISTLSSGEKEYYDIEIEKLNRNDSNKNMVIKVCDEDLINETGGIVQGMSGSPIIQNGMLIGAVTHVFLNNPLMGYGIFAENMLEISDSLKAGASNDSAA